MSKHSVTVRHNFEAGHRLPHLGGKCQNLHGHSWWAEVTVESSALTPFGTVVEYGLLKRLVREWIDTFLDHGLMLGQDDLLVDLLEPHGKVFVFGQTWPTREHGLDWPTVENVAETLAHVTQDIVDALAPNQKGEGAQVVRCRVNETHVNAAEWAL